MKKNKVKSLSIITVGLILLFIVSLFVFSGKIVDKSEWRAQWIWNAEHRPNNFAVFRKSFEFKGDQRKGILKITAQDRYVVWLNGVRVARGPARSGTSPKSYDQFDVTKFLKPGRNVLAILGYHYGISNNYGRDEPPGVLAQLEFEGQVLIATDASWLTNKGMAWRSEVPLMNLRHPVTGFTEVYDGNTKQANWTAVVYDDSDWRSAKVVAGPWKHLEPRRPEYLEEREIFPERIVSVSEVLDLMSSAGFHDVSQRLESEVSFPLAYAKIDGADAVLRFDGLFSNLQPHSFDILLPEVGIRDPVLIVDFGRMVYGRPKLRLHTDGPGANVDIAYAPTLLNGRLVSTGSGLRLADRYVVGVGPQEWEAFEARAFRYIKIVTRYGPVKIDSISISEVVHPAKQVGIFQSSDLLLNTLFKACIDTAKLSMEDALVTDVNHERRVFSGDGAHVVFSVLAGFGTPAVSDWYFDLMARGVTKEGLIRFYFPGTEANEKPPHDHDGQVISEKPLNIRQMGPIVWNTLWHHFEAGGNRELIGRIYPALIKSVDWFSGRLDEKGLIKKMPATNWDWLDWSKQDFGGPHLGTNALYFVMVKRASEFAKALHRDAEAKKYELLAQQAKVSIQREFWDDSRGIFADSIVDGKHSKLATEVGNGMILSFGIATESQAKRVAENLARGNLEPTTPLYAYYVLDGLFRLGHAREALKIMRDRYRVMLEHQPNPTIWSSWYPYAWRNNFGFYPSSAGYAHGGGTPAAYLLHRYILGVQPTAPGFARLKIEPQTADLVSASGAVPSPYGPVRVAWEKEDNGLRVMVDLPAGIEAEFVPPIGFLAKRISLRSGSNNLHIPYM